MYDVAIPEARHVHLRFLGNRGIQRFIGIFSTWLMGLLEKLAVPQERVVLFKVFQRKGKGEQA